MSIRSAPGSPQWWSSRGAGRDEVADRFGNSAAPRPSTSARPAADIDARRAGSSSSVRHASGEVGPAARVAQPAADSAAACAAWFATAAVITGGYPTHAACTAVVPAAPTYTVAVSERFRRDRAGPPADVRADDRSPSATGVSGPTTRTTSTAGSRSSKSKLARRPMPPRSVAPGDHQHRAMFATVPVCRCTRINEDAAYRAHMLRRRGTRPLPRTQSLSAGRGIDRQVAVRSGDPGRRRRSTALEPRSRRCIPTSNT